MQDSHPMFALQLCLAAALAAIVHSDCSHPNSLSFAVLRNTNININQSYPIGTELTYRCMPGHEPVPGTRPVIKCLETSKWSDVPPFCQGRHCPFPDIENGRIATMTDLRLGDQITFACNEGYRLIGDNGARCVLQADRVVWSRSPPRCQRIPCFPPPTIANGKHNGADTDSYEYGSAVTYICDSGISLIGDKTIICTVDEDGINGKWSGSIPRCEVVECRRPEISNGKILSSYQPSYTYGNTVMFGCHHGYILQGKNVIRCEANNTWQPALPRCVLRDCDPPKPISFAVLMNEQQRESYPVGTVLTYRCIPGYEEYIPGLNPSIQCLRTSEWSKTHSFCRKRRCPVPNILNGKIEDPPMYLWLDVEITFVCDKGYRLIGENTARCVLEEGDVTWNRDPPHCERIPCLPPPAIANGSFRSNDGNNFVYGTVVVYYCDSGFSLSGKNIIFCTMETNGLNTKWSGPAPECKGDCDPPKPISFAVLMNEQQRESYPVGTVLTYRCIPGYEEYIPGLNPSIQCLRTSEWSKTHSFCRKRRCPVPNILNGKIEGPPMYLWLDVEITFVCDKGYRLIGENTTRCVLEEGDVTWNRDPPHCELVNCRRPEVPNGIIEPSYQTYTYGHTVQFQCKTGHMLQGSRSSKCEADSSWHPAPPMCVLSGCDPPTGLYFAELLDAYKNKTYYPVGSIVKYKCQPGYTKQPKLPYSIECLESRKWSSVHVCERRQCPFPNIENGRITNDTGLRLGDKITFQCDEGHRLIGQDTARCVLLKNNTVDWDMDPPRCERIPCYPPPDIPHGKHNGRYHENFYYGSAVTYTCDKGYPLIGKAFIYCTTKDGENGEWSGRVYFVGFICIQCDPPPNIPHGKHNGRYEQNFYYGSAVTYTCDKGYPLIGKAFIYCTTKDGENGEWRGRVSCGVTPCPAPQVENGRIVAGDSGTYTYEHRVTLGCNAGYKLNGSGEISCQADGTWDPPVPHCKQAILCPTPQSIANGKYNSPVSEVLAMGCVGPEIQNGSITSSKVLFNPREVITVECDPGYILQGNSAIQCQSDGTWDSPVPICVKDGTLLPTSGSSFSSLSGTQAVPVTAPTYTSSLPTFQTELAWEKLFIVLQEIKDIVNIKTKSLEESLNALEKKVDKVIYQVQSCCQQAKEERLEEED